MAPNHGLKSVFVPADLLRPEIRIGYQAGGNDDEQTAEPVESPDSEAEEAPQTSEVFDTIEPDTTSSEAPAAETETPATETESPAAETETPAAETETPAAETESPATETETPPAETETETEDLQMELFMPDPKEGGGHSVAAPLDPVPGLPNLNGGGFDDESLFEQAGGGLFSDGNANVFNIMRTMLTSSATGASMADLTEDSLYEATVIKGHLDSIAQSLKAIADKYVGKASSGDRGNQGRRNQGRQSERSQPTDEWEDEAAAE